MMNLVEKVVRDRRGASVAEFAIMLPVFGTMLFGIVKFGIVYNNYLALTAAVANAERQFAVSRTTTTPYTAATNVLYSSAPSLVKANVTITTSVAGTACATDGACTTALSAASGSVSQVSANYPCDLVIMGVNFATNCRLYAQASERVE